MKWNDRIKQLRKAAEWSQDEFAEKVGVTRSTVANWEAARRIPDKEKFLKMAQLFNVSLDYLFEHISTPDQRKDILANTEAFFMADDVPAADKETILKDIMEIYFKYKGAK